MNLAIALSVAAILGGIALIYIGYTRNKRERKYGRLSALLIPFLLMSLISCGQIKMKLSKGEDFRMHFSDTTYGNYAQMMNKDSSIKVVGDTVKVIRSMMLFIKAESEELAVAREILSYVRMDGTANPAEKKQFDAAVKRWQAIARRRGVLK